MIDVDKNTSIISRRNKGSVIRELLKLTNQPGIISLAGGLPSPDSFPSEDMKDIASYILSEMPEKALQYAPTEGLPELKDQIIELMKEDGFENLTHDQILISTSSQQALDMIGKVFVDPTDPVLVELPTYVGGLQAFGQYGANFVGIKSDDCGIDISDLEENLKKLKDAGEHYKFIYTIPDFQNPSGVTWTAERRQKLVELAAKYDLIVIDDSPYKELRFEGERPPALHNLDKSGNVITLRSFSKTLAPGLRLGWVIANPEIIKKLALAKQSIDLCASTLIQLMGAEFIKRGKMQEQVKKVIDLYRVKRDAMLNALDKYMPKDSGISWTKPEGGLFMWVRLPEHVSADEMFTAAIEKKVAYVIGSAFHCNGEGQNTFRINFSYPSVEEIDEGIKRIAETIKENL